MKPQTETLLYYLMWTADVMMRPGWLNLDSGFEAWAWRNRLNRRLAELERQKLIERHPEPDLGRVVRLTEAGRVLALGGRDPIALWSRRWDARWRMVLFDLPAERTDLRLQLWRTLRQRHFGYLQNSVWISPDLVGDVRDALRGSKVQPDAFLVMEGRPAAGESDGEIVAAAWDYARINERYEQYFRVVARMPKNGARLVDWARQEDAAWRAALQLDPLLPAELSPSGYRGRDAFVERKRVFAQLAGQLPDAADSM